MKARRWREENWRRKIRPRLLSTNECSQAPRHSVFSRPCDSPLPCLPPNCDVGDDMLSIQVS